MQPQYMGQPLPFFPGTNPMQVGPIYVDPRTGQFVQLAAPQPFMTAAWQQGQHMPYLVPHQAGSPVAGMQLLPTVSSMPNMFFTPAAQQGSPRRSPPKRRRTKVAQETISQRAARAEQGYTYE